MAKYNEKELADTSKFLSFVLRHKPEAIGIAQEMAKRGLPFWQAENGVWLTSTVAVEFLEWPFMPAGVQKQ